MSDDNGFDESDADFQKSTSKAASTKESSSGQETWQIFTLWNKYLQFKTNIYTLKQIFIIWNKYV